MKETQDDLKAMVEKFLTYKGIKFLTVNTVNVKHNNIIISIQDSGNKRKFIEYNLSYLFSFLHVYGKSSSPIDLEKFAVDVEEAVNKEIDGISEQLKTISQEIDFLKAYCKELEQKHRQCIKYIDDKFEKPV